MSKVNPDPTQKDPALVEIEERANENKLVASATSAHSKALGYATTEELLGQLLLGLRQRPAAASMATDDEIEATLKDIGFNLTPQGLLFRRQPSTVTDPVTGQVVARPRPVLDAIKAMLTQFVSSAGPVLQPMLMQLITKLLSGFLNPAAGATPASANPGEHNPGDTPVR